jgi:hypothetical protein
MGHLARDLRLSGPTHGCPPISFLPVHDTWYPWYKISSAAPECLASELCPNVLDLPVLEKLPSALSNLRSTCHVLPGSSRVLNDSGRVSSSFLKMWIGAPIRSSPRLPYQISPRIDSVVKPCFSNVDSLLNLKTSDQNSHQKLLSTFIFYTWA